MLVKLRDYFWESGIFAFFYMRKYNWGGGNLKTIGLFILGDREKLKPIS